LKGYGGGFEPKKSRYKVAMEENNFALPPEPFEDKIFDLLLKDK
jgi:hypothetical protein